MHIRYPRKYSLIKNIAPKERHLQKFIASAVCCLVIMSGLAINHASAWSRQRSVKPKSKPWTSNTTPTTSTTPAPSTNVGTVTPPVTPPVTTPTPIPSPLSATPTPPQSIGDHAVGLSAGDLVSLSPSQLATRLQNFQDLGATWVRFDIPWSVVQASGETSYRWDIYDKVFDALAGRPLQALVVLDYTPTWARPAGCSDQGCRPNDVSKFAAYAKIVVERYKGRGVKYWEVWNEPNHNGFWNPTPNASQYVSLLKATYASIKAADPSAVVLTGGLSPAFSSGGEIGPKDFITALYAQGAKGSFDGVAMHPYSFPALPGLAENWNGWQQMLEIRNVMVANGDGAKKVWLTEYGAPTGGPGPLATLSNFNFSQIPDHVDEALQARLASDAINLFRTYDWVGPLFWHRYQDTGTSQSTNENFFGLIRNDGSKKPVYDVIYGALR